MTYLLRTLPESNPSPDDASRLRPSVHRLRGGSVLVLVLVLLLWALPVCADAPIDIVSTQSRYIFSESLIFSIEASSTRPIVEAVLFYGRDGERLVRRIYPNFAPGTEIRIEYVEDLEKGQFAPGTLIHSWWQLATDDGGVGTSDRSTLEYTDDNHDWQSTAGERVDLFWYGSDEDDARDLQVAADEAVMRLEEEIGVSVDRRASVYVYNSERDMDKALSQRSEAFDDRVLTLGVKVDEDTLLLLGTHRDARLTLAHELCHIVVGIATDNPYADLPRWLDEGLAMYAEGQLPPDNRQAFERAIDRDELLSIRSMTSYSGRPELVDLYYGEVYSVVDFMLREYGRDKMRELLDVFSEGARQEEALLQVYHLGLDELDSRWRASLGLGPRESPEAEAPPPVTEERPSPQRKPFCSYSAGGLLIPLLGGALSPVVKRWAGAG